MPHSCSGLQQSTGLCFVVETINLLEKTFNYDRTELQHIYETWNVSSWQKTFILLYSKMMILSIKAE